MDKISNFNKILKSFRIDATCKDFIQYKNACHYDIELQPGTRIKEIEKYISEFSLALKAASKPNLRPIPELGLLRMEFINSQCKKINLFELGNKVPLPPGKLNCLLGETFEGDPLWIDIVNNPHMLVAGTTGSGKSTMLHALIANILLYKNVELVLMDPKNIEFYKYSDLGSRKIKICFDYADCLSTLNDISQEMERRYNLIKKYRLSSDYFPYKVLIIDEFADLISQDTDFQFKSLLGKLAQKSRAAGIHIILATQRPSVDIVDGSIKSNFPARLSCKVASGVDSKVILDTVGAETLMGHGDALIKTNYLPLKRFQGAFTNPEEILHYLKKS